MIGFLPIAHMLPAPSPSWTGQQVVDWYRDNLTGIRVGMVIDVLAIALLAPYGAVIAVRTRKTETGLPIYTYIQLACLGCGVMDAMMTPLVFSWAAFRPGEMDPDITRSINDFGWFAFLFTFPPFTVWCISIACAIFTNRSEHRLLPRWIGYVNIWAGLLYFPAAMLLFFKRGVLAYNGLLALYVPLAAFLLWMVLTTIELVKTIKADTGGTSLEQGVDAVTEIVTAGRGRDLV
ncbi:hypothetical protein ACFXG4_43155 [Nocardia sp. NPDC059246]|uniref:hypothetical protein n=1 Tax=unclassified Nocardia TaxID=2637762 RepID=UPI0036B428A2